MESHLYLAIEPDLTCRKKLLAMGDQELAAKVQQLAGARTLLDEPLAAICCLTNTFVRSQDLSTFKFLDARQ